VERAVEIDQREDSFDKMCSFKIAELAQRPRCTKVPVAVGIAAGA
jgi:hypothetical protein